MELDRYDIAEIVQEEIRSMGLIDRDTIRDLIEEEILSGLSLYSTEHSDRYEIRLDYVGDFNMGIRTISTITIDKNTG